MWDKWRMFNGFSNLCLSSGFLRVCVCDKLLYPYRRCFWGMCCPFLYLLKSITYIHLTHKGAKPPMINGRYWTGASFDPNGKTPDDGKLAYHNPPSIGELAAIPGMCEPARLQAVSRPPTLPSRARSCR